MAAPPLCLTSKAAEAVLESCFTAGNALTLAPLTSQKVKSLWMGGRVTRTDAALLKKDVGVGKVRQLLQRLTSTKEYALLCKKNCGYDASRTVFLYSLRLATEA